MVYWLTFILLYGSIFFLPPTVRDLLYREDGVIEWVAAIAWTSAGIVYFLCLRMALKSRAITSGFWLTGLCLICLFAAGEEISWGQRVLGYKTPSLIGQSNLQEEMNIHNLKWLDVRTGIGEGQKSGIQRWLTFNRLGTLIWLGFLVVLPLSVHHDKTISNLSRRLGMPTPPVSIALAATTGYAIFFLLKNVSEILMENPGKSLFSSPLNECKETVIAVLFLGSALHCFRVLRKSQGHAYT